MYHDYCVFNYSSSFFSIIHSFFFSFFSSSIMSSLLIYEREKERDFSLGLFAFRNAFKRNYFVPRTRKYSFLIKLEKKIRLHISHSSRSWIIKYTRFTNENKCSSFNTFHDEKKRATFFQRDRILNSSRGFV